MTTDDSNATLATAIEAEGRATAVAELARVLETAKFQKFGYPFTPMEIAAAILGALPGWCGHEAEIAVLNAGEAHWHKRATLAEAEIARLKRLQPAHHRMLRVTAVTCDACKHERVALAPTLNDIHGTPTFSG